MSEYIEREAVEKAVLRYSNGDVNKQELFMLTDLLGDITDIPTADVQPVKRGRWIIADDVKHFIAVCSECGRTEDSRCIKDMPYCHCGARMEQEDCYDNGKS